MKKYYPYISIAIGFGVMALYLYSTKMHNEYMKEEGDRIVNARNIKIANNYIKGLGTDVSFEFWIGETGDTLYRTFKDFGGDLLLTELVNNDSWRMLRVGSQEDEMYKYADRLNLKIAGETANLEKDGVFDLNLILAK